MSDDPDVARPGRIPASELRTLLERALRDGAGGKTLHGALRVEYVPNWGGFVNASFRVIGDHTDIRLKLTQEPGAIRDMRRWEQLAPILEERHHAPRMLGWFRVPGTSYEGPIFEWVRGVTPGDRGEGLIARVDAMLDRLHQDVDLAVRLRTVERRDTCRDVYVGILDDRLREDLRLVDADRPPFVSAADVAWMREEVERLALQVASSSAFDEPAVAPSHGDLWLENVLIGGDGRLVVLDWDGIAPGDPVFDWATFVGPTRASLRPARLEDVPHAPAWPDGWRARLATYARAGVLDCIVDGLADWIDATALGEHQDEARAQKQDAVEAALESYRREFRPR